MPYADLAQQRKYQREWMARRRAEWLAGKSCAICGSTENLEVDHVDPSAKVEHRVWSWTATRREEELAKCQVLCEAHHAEKSLREQLLPDGVRHGTAGSWRRAKCRCTVCRAWQSRTTREYRARKRRGVTRSSSAPGLLYGFEEDGNPPRSGRGDTGSDSRGPDLTGCRSVEDRALGVREEAGPIPASPTGMSRKGFSAPALGAGR